MTKPNCIRIAITGPESTGKSSLAEALAQHYQTVWVPEFARGFLEKLNREYDYNDILEIAQGQMQAEDQLSENHSLVFLDTELLVTKIWCEVKYNRCHPWILSELKQRKYDLVLLCNTDLPWEYDPQREHPDKRGFLMDLYRSQIGLYYKNVVEISGSGHERFQQAIDAVKQLVII